MPTFQDIIKQSDWNKIQYHFLQWHPKFSEIIEKYITIFESLKNIQPVQTQMQIHLEIVNKTLFKDDDDETYVSVSGLENNEEGILTHYSIILMEWNKWLGCTISESTMHDFEKEEIIAHCLFEMTYYGKSEEEIKQQKEEIFNSPVVSSHLNLEDFWDDVLDETK